MTAVLTPSSAQIIPGSGKQQTLEELGIKRFHLLQAEQVSHRISGTLTQRGLSPALRETILTRHSEMLIFVYELEVSRIERMEAYRSEDLLHQMSANLQGMKVYLSNSTGLRYVVALNKIPGLPKRVGLPIELSADGGRGALDIGINYEKKNIRVEWDDLGHLLVAGMTGSGKSMFLRLVVAQAIRDGMKLLLADIDQATFPMLAKHPSLYAPLAANTEQALELIRKALDECDRRAALFQSMSGYPENLDEYNRLAIQRGEEPLPRILLVLDEFSATLSALGGGRGDAGKLLSAIGFRGRKFGISIVFAAHEFTKEQVGLMRDQVRTVVMLRVQGKEMAKRMGCEGAERIDPSRPGLAMTNRWGPLQTYFLEKSALIANPISPLGGGMFSGNALALSPVELGVFRAALSNTDGVLTRNSVMQWSASSEWQTRKWMDTWALRGWIAKDPQRNNAYAITPRARESLRQQEAGG